jgi:hypothetical protein
VQRIISKRLLMVAAMVAMVLVMAVPTFAQVLPQSDPGVNDPVAGDGSVSNQDATSPDPSSTEDGALPTTTTTTTTTDAANDPATPAEDSATDVIPIKLSSELCAEVTDPLVSGTFAHVLPELVQGCLKRTYVPAGSTAPVQSASEPTHTPPVNPAPVVEPGGSVKTSPADPATTDTSPADTTPADSKKTASIQYSK